MTPNPVVSKDTSKNIPVYTVKKILTDEETVAKKGVFIKDSMYPVVLKDDADVYTENGELLLRFRKNVLSQNAIDDAYDALQEHMKKTTTDRGTASGSDKGLGTGEKKPVMSNILGYFDKWSISQKATFKNSKIRYPGPCRLCTFNVKNPEKWKKVVPLIQEIDAQYEKLCPKEYANQRKAAKSTPFHIKGTAFSTITTNLNFRTAAHTDSGDWPTGFGNLVVIEKGSPYEGAYTGFPQYGVAVDCRNGDFLAMDVHQVHGNSPMDPQDETSHRLSLVSYLREGIINKCGNQKMYDAQALEDKLNRWRA
ncbi:MAG: hypothetical protein EBU33_02835, partial [Sphingobacteriia bacterium]|nr:hypothetical protein [Sphingobacteriia bacterium]